MSEVILYGLPVSSYMRTAIMTCAEKGAQHKVVVQPPHSPQQLEVHPFGKMPAMQHGDVRLFETSAICRYVDQVFDGPSLIPQGAADAGLMEQWISVASSYLYVRIVMKYAMHYIAAGFQGKEPDRAAVEGGVADLKSGLEIFDKGYDGRDWLAGDSMSLADLFMAPLVQTAASFPEGQEALPAYKNVKRAYEAMAARDSFAAAHPKPA